MAAGRYNFKLDQGASFTLPITWKDSGDSPIDLTGYSAKFTVLDADNNALLELTDGSGITLGGAAGTISVAFTPTQTNAFAFVSAKYVLELTVGSTQTHLLRGLIEVNRGDA